MLRPLSMLQCPTVSDSVPLRDWCAKISEAWTDRHQHGPPSAGTHAKPCQTLHFDHFALLMGSPCRIGQNVQNTLSQGIRVNQAADLKSSMKLKPRSSWELQRHPVTLPQAHSPTALVSYCWYQNSLAWQDSHGLVQKKCSHVEN